jgi:hypothetical protein
VHLVETRDSSSDNDKGVKAVNEESSAVLRDVVQVIARPRLL